VDIHVGERVEILPGHICELGEEIGDTGIVERIEVSSGVGLAHVAIERLDAIVRVRADDLAAARE
jgi:hypothetical protein